MYCCQNLADMKLADIARNFGLKGDGGVSAAIFDIRRQVTNGELEEVMVEIKEILNLIKRT